MAEDSLLFSDRFLDRYAGSIITDPATAIVELVANAWDAHATQVSINWPAPGQPFSIRDNGIGMTASEFTNRWRTLDYDRLRGQGDRTTPPADVVGANPRAVYGRNGKGRHAAFLFGNTYRVRTWRDGIEHTYSVTRGRAIERPFEVEQVNVREGVGGHGTEVIGTEDGVGLSADDARATIGARFLTDPGFVVTVNGTAVSFEDLSDESVVPVDLEVPNRGTVRVLMIDGQRADRTTKQHGIAWWVNHRLVGDCRWRGSDLVSVVDGRTALAKRFTFIVLADFLEEAVRDDWSDFVQSDAAWLETRAVVNEFIRKSIEKAVAAKRADAKLEVQERLHGVAQRLTPASRDRWDRFVGEVIDTCPSITTDEVTQIASVLARLEASSSKYELINKLHEMQPGDLDALNILLADWSVRTAKEALDEIQGRLKLIAQMHETLRDERADEVRDLQPLFERSLWAFGPEFESIEFTSNRGMSTVIQKLFPNSYGDASSGPAGSLKRPDFAVLPESSVGLFSRPSFDQQGEPIGTAHLVVVELKRPGLTIAAPQMEQARSYVRELRKKGLLEDATKVTCFVLGSKRDPIDTEPVQQGQVTTIALTFDAFIVRAERRMLNLYDRVKDAPFLRDQDLDLSTFGQGISVIQRSMV